MANDNGFDKFCGGPLWNYTLTWNTDHPDFTRCFQQSVLVWVPCGFLFVSLPFYVHYLRSLPSSSETQYSFLCKIKMVISVLLIILSTSDFIKGIIDFEKNGPAILIVSPLITMISFIVSTVLIRMERHKAMITSGIQFLFYLLLIVSGIVPFHSYIYQATVVTGRVEDPFRLAIFYTSYALLLVEFTLFCFADSSSSRKQAEHVNNKKPCPEEECSFLSRITFQWMQSLIFMGYNKNLVEDDMWLPNQRDVTGSVSPRFEKYWTEELARCGWSLEHTNTSTTHRASTIRRQSSVRYSRDQERTPLLIDVPKSLYSQTPDVHIETPARSPSFFRTLVRVYGWTLLKAHLCKVVCDVLTFVGPLLQSALIAFTEDDEPVWKGYLYAVLFFIQSFITSCFFHQVFHIGLTLGMRIKASVISLIYKKALSMSNEARKTTTVGEIVNLMSVDAQRLQDAVGYLWMIWSAPLQISIAIYMLWRLLGIATLAGLTVMIVLIPLNGIIVRFSKNLQLKQMALKDQRIKLMNEVLNGIKVLKLYAWEVSYQKKVSAIREEELETLKKYSYLSSVGTFLWTCAPFVVTLATFTTYILTGGVLDAGTAFTALSLFNILRFPMNMLPMMINYLVTASVSVNRVGAFLLNKDIDSRNVQHELHGSGNPIDVNDGLFAWGTSENDAPILNNVNLAIKNGSLVAIVGQVGSGKSSLLSAILGEMEKLRGTVTVRGSVAYAAQQAWIQNATLRDNILFGQPYDENRYNAVLDACAMRPDLLILPAGDMTEIGEKGINLSGGQKQRVSLARAIYQDCDIYLLDDPLSAVDSHVGKHIFEHVLSNENGLLKNKTRVLVTHGIHWLPRVDDIAVLSNACISETGSYEELMSYNQSFARFLKTYLTHEGKDDDQDDAELKDIKSQIIQRVMSIASDEKAVEVSAEKRATASPKYVSEAASLASEGRAALRQSSSLAREVGKRQMSKPDSVAGKQRAQIGKEKNTIIQDETSATGKVAISVYISYCKSIGLVLSCITLVAFLLYQVASIGSSVWLSVWTEDINLKNTTISNTSFYTGIQHFYLGIYGGFGLAQAIFVLAYALIFALTSVRSSRVLHADMLYNVLRSPMMFFETTPVGRILNRFSRDIETIDNVLPQLIRGWLNTFFSAVSTIVIISYSTPIFLAVVVPLFVIYIFIQRFYIPTSRQLKRIESTTRSPIYVHFSETITGCSTIRAFQRGEQFMHHSEKLVDHNLVFYFANISSNRWLGFRLEMLGGLVVFSAALFAVIGRSTISGGIVGLSISYALQVTQALNWMVRNSTDLETNIVSVERVNEYSNTPTEAHWYNGVIKPPRTWPASGQISFSDYSTRYRPGLDLVLRHANMDIKAGEKIGIVGRTGAGKSSMTLALFRLIEAVEGSITIDGLKISDIALYQLRSKLVILPQDPVLFSGTLRMNLDPFEMYTDDQIWRALEHAHLKNFVSTLPTKIEHECGEGGNNLSVGQRQLVCLARAILRKTKILVLDEATAAVDIETDELIQNTIRQEFADCTVLTIAHRLNTIMDSDRVMVLDAGVIREFDSPANLLANKTSMFHSLASDIGIVKSESGS